MTVIAMMMANDKILLFIFGLLSTLGVTVFMYKYTHNHGKFKANMLFFLLLITIDYERIYDGFLCCLFTLFKFFS